jgi:hydrogenase nickel incorporation protein HypA/HybF
MHELGIAQQIIDIARQGSGDARITRVVVSVGKLTAVLPDALRFCFDLATDDTPMKGALLEIREVAGDELKVSEVEVI